MANGKRCEDCLFFEADNKWCGKIGLKVLAASFTCLFFLEGWGGDDV